MTPLCLPTVRIVLWRCLQGVDISLRVEEAGFEGSEGLEKLCGGIN